MWNVLWDPRFGKVIFGTHSTLMPTDNGCLNHVEFLVQVASFHDHLWWRWLLEEDPLLRRQTTSVDLFFCWRWWLWRALTVPLLHKGQSCCIIKLSCDLNHLSDFDILLCQDLSTFRFACSQLSFHPFFFTSWSQNWNDKWSLMWLTDDWRILFSHQSLGAGLWTNNRVKQRKEAKKTLE